ncbi:MAG TPA: biotin--[acetyl-CoA-carboxylase] ligase [Terrimesophilobacter sp.]|nr:biotin--[acetyl-CoA-carboxylase] ligase [Terrimesophilobacter sp.]
MDFPRTRSLGTDLVVLEQAASTNDELAARATDAELAELTAVVTTNQTAGRGRLDRSWVTPPGQALAVSVLLRPAQVDGSPVDREQYGWIPLIAGLAMTRAVRGLVTGHEIALKWPNDVLIDGLKVSGLLSELLPNGRDVIVGAGLNLTTPADALPVPTATSLVLCGVTMAAEELADAALAGYLGELRAAWGAFVGSKADARASGIRNAVSAACSTLGSQVRVSLPDGTSQVGTAVELDGGGRLRIRTATDGRMVTVAAGDVTHLRYE